VDRALLTLLLIFVILLAAGGLLLGWRHRAQRQADVPELPEVPDRLGDDLVDPLPALYVASTRSGSWQDRIVVHTLGRRARAEVHAVPEGILIDRIGETPIWIPADRITLITTAPGIAGKVMGLPDGILVLSWRLGERLLDTGLRADDPQQQQDWIAAARTLITSGLQQSDDYQNPLPAPGQGPGSNAEQPGRHPGTDGAA
jgi:hypothetical protein